MHRVSSKNKSLTIFIESQGGGLRCHQRGSATEGRVGAAPLRPRPRRFFKKTHKTREPLQVDADPRGHPPGTKTIV